MRDTINKTSESSPERSLQKTSRRRTSTTHAEKAQASEPRDIETPLLMSDASPNGTLRSSHTRARQPSQRSVSPTLRRSFLHFYLYRHVRYCQMPLYLRNPAKYPPPLRPSKHRVQRRPHLQNPVFYSTGRAVEGSFWYKTSSWSFPR